MGHTRREANARATVFALSYESATVSGQGYALEMSSVHHSLQNTDIFYFCKYEPFNLRLPDVAYLTFSFSWYSACSISRLWRLGLKLMRRSFMLVTSSSFILIGLDVTVADPGQITKKTQKQRQKTKLLYKLHVAQKPVQLSFRQFLSLRWESVGRWTLKHQCSPVKFPANPALLSMNDVSQQTEDDWLNGQLRPAPIRPPSWAASRYPRTDIWIFADFVDISFLKQHKIGTS